MEGPYIHHCVGIHKNVVPVLYEACKYIGIAPDLYDDNEEEVRAYIVPLPSIHSCLFPFAFHTS
mgnify:CR=1 FL=1